MLFELRSLKEDSGNTKISPYKSNKTIFSLGGGEGGGMMSVKFLVGVYLFS